MDVPPRSRPLQALGAVLTLLMTLVVAAPTGIAHAAAAAPAGDVLSIGVKSTDVVYDVVV